MEGPPAGWISGDDFVDAMKAGLVALNPEVAEAAEMDLLRTRLVTTPSPLTYAQLLTLVVVTIGNDPTTAYFEEGMGVLGASRSLAFYVEGMELAFGLTKEEAMRVARRWTHVDICPKKGARMADVRAHVASSVLSTIKEKAAEAQAQGKALCVFGYGAWPDTFQSLDFESAELRCQDYCAAKVETHNGANIAYVSVKGTPLAFRYGGYPHPGCGGQGWAEAFAPRYAKFLRSVLAASAMPHQAIECPSALREAFGLPRATKKYFCSDGDEAAACDDDSAEEE